MKKHDISEYNEIIHMNDDIYSDLARHFGMTDGVFWILYTLRDAARPVTQSEICGALYSPKQTVSSALKKLEGDGCIQYLPSPDRRSKLIALTDRGVALCEVSADIVLRMENEALDALGEQTRVEFLSAFRRYTEFMSEKTKNIKNK